jgi:hypothetical protein
MKKSPFTVGLLHFFCCLVFLFRRESGAIGGVITANFKVQPEYLLMKTRGRDKGLIHLIRCLVASPV